MKTKGVVEESWSVTTKEDGENPIEKTHWKKRQMNNWICQWMAVVVLN
jgi:hypothetical protein